MDSRPCQEIRKQALEALRPVSIAPVRIAIAAGQGASA
jgi:hypothetical protein